MSADNRENATINLIFFGVGKKLIISLRLFALFNIPLFAPLRSSKFFWAKQSKVNLLSGWSRASNTDNCFMHAARGDG